MRETWNNRYNRNEYIYGRVPNEFLKTFIDIEKPGSILLPCEGEGRNAVYAGLKGWQVYALDFSEIARDKALKLAESSNVSINYDLAEINEWDSEVKFDCIAMIYCHFPSVTRQNLHRKLISMLKPSGKVVMECFSKKQEHYDSGGPSDPDALYDTDILRDDFRPLKIEFLQERIVTLNEGLFHRGEASILRMIAVNY